MRMDKKANSQSGFLFRANFPYALIRIAYAFALLGAERKANSLFRSNSLERIPLCEFIAEHKLDGIPYWEFAIRSRPCRANSEFAYSLKVSERISLCEFRANTISLFRSNSLERIFLCEFRANTNSLVRPKSHSEFRYANSERMNGNALIR